MTQHDSTFGWLPLLRNSRYEAWLIRARDNRLVLKIVVNLEDSQLLTVVPKADILRLWAKAFKSVK